MVWLSFFLLRRLLLLFLLLSPCIYLASLRQIAFRMCKGFSSVINWFCDLRNCIWSAPMYVCTYRCAMVGKIYFCLFPQHFILSLHCMHITHAWTGGPPCMCSGVCRLRSRSRAGFCSFSHKYKRNESKKKKEKALPCRNVTMCNCKCICTKWLMIFDELMQCDVMWSSLCFKGSCSFWEY